MRVRQLAPLALLAFVLAACGAAVDLATDQLEFDEGAFEPGAGVSDNATAVLVVGDTTYTFEKNEWTTCDIGGALPVWIGFQNAEFNWDDDWVQFIDREDGINFSAYLDGKEYSGTGSGEPDEIRSDGFTYTGDMGVEGETVDVRIDVTC